MTKRKFLREILIMAVMLLAIGQAVRAIYISAERQFFLHKQSAVLKAGRAQSESINKELRDGLTSYRSSTGIERLARERLNLSGPNEIIVRIGQ